MGGSVHRELSADPPGTGSGAKRQVHALLRLATVTTGIGALALAFMLAFSGGVVAAKQFTIQGTVDCGRSSGQHCDVGPLITVWTSDVSGNRERITVDVSWVLSQLDEYDQDDLIMLEIEAEPDGTLRAVTVIDSLGGPDHTKSSGRQDDDPPKPPPPASDTPTPTMTATRTVTPSPTGTSTATRTATPSPTGTPSPTATATSTATPTATSTATPTSTSTPTPTPAADLSLAKVDNSFVLCGGDCAGWTVTITNSGPNPASNVTVQDFPQGFSIDSGTTSKGSFSTLTNVWTVGSLAVGESATLDLTAGFTPTLFMTNCAEVLHSDQFDPNSTPNNGNPAENDRACADVETPR